MDLFSQQVEVDRQHIYFRELVSGNHPEKVALLESWARDFQDRDGKFVKEFQTTFNSAFWELYLHQAFSLLGGQVDMSAPRPDFLVRFPQGLELVAEATTTSNADGYVPQWQPDFLQVPPLEALLEYQSIRLANALASKIKKYRTAYANLPHVIGKPYVICVAPFEQQWSNSLGDRAMRRVLLGLDVPLLDRATDGTMHVVGAAHTERAWKPNGAEVNFGLFRDDSAAEVSGVLFGPLATFGKLSSVGGNSARLALVRAERFDPHSENPRIFGGPISGYRESVLDGLHVFVNPNARIPLDTSVFERHELAVHHFRSDSTTLITTMPDGFLLSRMVISVNDRGRSILPQTPREGLKRATIAAFPDCALHRVGGGVGLTTDAHLAHHRNWTVLVCRDVVDNDWGAMARPGLFRDVNAFRDANLEDDSEMLLCRQFEPTKEQAHQAMVTTINGALDGGQNGPG